MKISPHVEYRAADSINMAATDVYVFACSGPREAVIALFFNSSRVTIPTVVMTLRETDRTNHEVVKSTPSLVQRLPLGLLSSMSQISEDAVTPISKGEDESQKTNQQNQKAAAPGKWPNNN